MAEQSMSLISTTECKIVFEGSEYDVMTPSNHGESVERYKKKLTACLVLLESLLSFKEVITSHSATIVIDKKHLRIAQIEADIETVYCHIFEALEGELNLLPNEYSLLLNYEERGEQVDVNIAMLIGKYDKHSVGDIFEIIDEQFDLLPVIGLTRNESFDINRANEKSLRNGIYKLSAMAL